MFNYYHEFYGVYLGLGIRKQLGKKYIYQIVNGVQRKYPYVVPSRPNTPGQQKMTDLLKKAVQSWHTLTSTEKKYYDDNTPLGKTMSGFNYFVSLYINSYK